jgi:hypothetical protein
VPTCFACLDDRRRGQQVLCPKTGTALPNVARSPEENRALAALLFGGDPAMALQVITQACARTRRPQSSLDALWEK